MGRGVVRLLALALALTGCSGLTRTPHLATYDPGKGYRYDNLAHDNDARTNAEDLFVILCISGGGMRAAALGYGVMESLRDTRIAWRGRERTLLQEVDVIAGVSGGAFPAAYYAAFGDRLFVDFRQRFLYRNISLDLGLHMLWPNWIPDPQYGRSDVAADWYDRRVFGGATYGDLLERMDAPFLILNGTDMASAAPFAFTQAQFDLICGDLSGLTLARAVAASSAFPFLLSPLTLENRSGTCGFEQDAAIEATTADPTVFSHLDDADKFARPDNGIGSRPYIHILDGGISDYLGLRTALLELDRGSAGWKLSQAVADGEIKKIVVLVVDAWVDQPPSDGRSAEPPGVVAAIETLAYRAVEGSRDSRPILRDWLARAGFPEGPPHSYYIHIAFERLASPEQRERFNRIPTSLALPAQDIDELRSIGAALLKQCPDFRQLTAEL